MPVMVVVVVLFMQNDIKRMIHYLSKRMTRHRIKKVRVSPGGTRVLMLIWPQQNYRPKRA